MMVLFLSACATDGTVEEQAPTVDLTPRLLVNKSNFGDDSPVMLEVRLKTGALAGNPYDFSESPVDTVSTLFADALSEQGFTVYTSEEYLPEHAARLVVQIDKLQFRTQESAVSSTIKAEVRLKATARSPKGQKTIELETRREQEVAMTPSLDDISRVVGRALAQAAERAVKDETFLSGLKVDKPKQEESDGLFGL
jgi:hypothetical protein